MLKPCAPLYSLMLERKSLAAPGAFAGAADVRCDVAAFTGAKLLRNGLENVIFSGHQL